MKKKRIVPITLKAVLLIIMNGVVLSCAQERSINPTPTETIIPTSTLVPTVTPRPTNTPDPTRTPTLTPVPTLSFDQIFDLIMEVESQFEEADFEGAIETCNEILAYPLADKFKGWIYFMRALAYDYLGERSAALEDYLQAYELGNREADLMNFICWDYALLGQPQKGLPFCEEAVEEPSAAYKDSRGLTFALLGNYEEAVEDFQDFVDSFEVESGVDFNPTYRSRMQWLATLKEGENPFTKEVLEELSQPDYFIIADNLIKSEAYEAAIDVLSTAIEQDPELVEAYNTRGTLYKDHFHKFDLAIADFNKALELEPQHVGALINRGNAYDKKGEPDRAIEDCNSALEIDPQFAQAFHTRGLAYHNKGEDDRALDDFDKAIELKPDYSYAFNSRCLFFRNLLELDKALEDCNTAIEIDPNFAAALFNRGFVYTLLDDFDNAVSDLTRAIELDPQYAPAYVIRGYAYADMGNTQSAIADLRQALAIGLKPGIKADVEEVLNSLGD